MVPHFKQIHPADFAREPELVARLVIKVAGKHGSFFAEGYKRYNGIYVFAEFAPVLFIASVIKFNFKIAQLGFEKVKALDKLHAVIFYGFEHLVINLLIIPAHSFHNENIFRVIRL